MNSHFRYGLLCACAAYGLWGLLPIYWKLIERIPATEILGHRIVWSFLFLALIISCWRSWPGFKALFTRRTAGVLGVTALLIAFNWLLYIWGVNNGRIVECSLGYFILPLMNVAFGVIVLSERLRPLQGLSIAIAALGVGVRAWDVGGVPVISLSLAVTFALYGILRKHIAVNSITGLAFETAVLLPPALVFLAYREFEVTHTLASASTYELWLLAGAGAITTIPLLAFGEAAKHLPLTVLGLMQYIAPSLQFLCGVLLYREPMPPQHWTAFVLIWGALVLFSMDSVRAMRVASAQRAA